MTALVTEKVIEAVEEFCEKMTHQAENIRDQISIDTIPPAPPLKEGVNNPK